MLTIPLSSEIEQALALISRQQGTSQAEVVAKLIAGYLENTKPIQTVYQLAEEMGIIGSFDGPVDLAENHRQCPKINGAHYDR